MATDRMSERGSRSSSGWALGSVVLLVVLGILGMHALSSGHLVHTPSTSSSSSSSANAAAHDGPGQAAHGPAASCDGECQQVGLQIACLAVLVAAVVLLTRRRESVLDTFHRWSTRRPSLLREPTSAPRTAPSLHVLCISRT